MLKNVKNAFKLGSQAWNRSNRGSAAISIGITIKLKHMLALIFGAEIEILFQARQIIVGTP